MNQYCLWLTSSDTRVWALFGEKSSYASLLLHSQTADGRSLEEFLWFCDSSIPSLESQTSFQMLCLTLHLTAFPSISRTPPVLFLTASSCRRSPTHSLQNHQRRAHMQQRHVFSINCNNKKQCKSDHTRSWEGALLWTLILLFLSLYRWQVEPHRTFSWVMSQFYMWSC